VSVLEERFGFEFAPIVSQAYGWNTIATLDILFLRASDPGQLIRHGGDIDNRVKVLFDTLRMPQNRDELPADAKPAEGEAPFCVLLQDDALITSYSVTADRLLAPPNAEHVELIITVNTRATRASMFNDPIR
jgi:hypothetical protein